MNTPHSTPPAAMQTRSMPHVLLVDDEPGVLALGTVILESKGCAVTGVSGGAEALNAIANAEAAGSPVEVVVLDMTLPGGASGFEVLEAIQNHYPCTPVIACSGYFQSDARELCRSLGFADILPKPYTPEAMVQCVRRAHLALSKSDSVPVPG